MRALLCLASVLVGTLSQIPPVATAAPARGPIDWKPVAPGISTAEYLLGDNEVVFSKPVRLIRLQTKQVQLRAVYAEEEGGTTVRKMARVRGGVVGINANFFDENRKPLGLVITDGKLVHGLQRGGSTLTGIFLLRDGRPEILHRDDYVEQKGVTLAVQAGPRLVSNGKAISVRVGQEASRRSGIAVTFDGDILLFATVLRFPGATFEDIMRMLLDPSLKIKDAMNLDGGGSSQLFVEATKELPQEVFIHGGDLVPVGLVVYSLASNSQK